MNIAIKNATILYDRTTVVENLTLSVTPGSFTAILGPNGCGKSTLLRACARVVPLTTGSVMLDGEPIARMRAKEVARQVGLLPQSSIAPEGISVFDLVARGRSPHQSWAQQWRATDEHAVLSALTATHLVPLASRRVEELSGGQRQRVWIAMLLAQETQTLLLDEPTTFLDIAHQYELMELLRSLNEGGKTIVAVLHDINQAARYADHVVLLNDGRIVAEGTPHEVVRRELITEVFGLHAEIFPDPISGTPWVVPLDPRGVAGQA